MSLATRRRRVLLVALGMTGLTSVLSLLAVLSSLVPVLAAVLSTGYVVHLRVQARRRLEIHVRRARAARSADARMHRLDSASRLVTSRLERLRHLSGQLSAHTAPAAAVSEPHTEDASVTAGWQPVPVPLPTYVTKPRAPRTARPIDLSGPRVTSAGRVAGQAPLEAGEAASAAVAGSAAQPTAQPTAQPLVAGGSSGQPSPPRASNRAGLPFDQELDDELDAILEHRRAVND